MFLEDAGFDWKVLGPDVSDVDYVAWQSDQDAYACSGQKCSAQSILFMHENWANAGARRAQGLGLVSVGAWSLGVCCGCAGSSMAQPSPAENPFQNIIFRIASEVGCHELSWLGACRV